MLQAKDNSWILLSQDTTNMPCRSWQDRSGQSGTIQVIHFHEGALLTGCTLSGHLYESLAVCWPNCTSHNSELLPVILE